MMNVTIRCPDGRWWTVGPDLVVVAGEEPVVFVQRHLGGHEFTLEAPNGLFVCAEGGGTEGYLIADRPDTGEWEVLTEGFDATEGMTHVSNGWPLHVFKNGTIGALPLAGVTFHVEALPEPTPEPEPEPEPEPGPGPEPGPQPGPAPQPLHPNPLVGALACNGASYWVGQQRVLPLAAHIGDGLSRWTRNPIGVIRDGFEPCRQHGYQIVRTWINLADTGYWAGRGVGPRLQANYRQMLDSYLRVGADHQLQFHLCCGALDNMNNAEENELIDLMADVVKGVERDYGPVVALFESANEVAFTGDTDDKDPLELTRIRDRFTSRCGRSSVLTALTAYMGHEDIALFRQFTPNSQGFVYYHSDRSGVTADKVHRAFSMKYEVVKGFRSLLWSGEPPGPGPRVSAISGEAELRGAEALALLGVAQMAGGVYTFFSSDGVVLEQPLSNYAGFAEIGLLNRRMQAWAPDLHAWPTLTHVADYKPERLWDLPNNDIDVRLDQYVDYASRRGLGFLYAPTSRSTGVKPLGDMQTTVVDPAYPLVDVAQTGSARFQVNYRYGRVLLAEW